MTPTRKIKSWNKDLCGPRANAEQVPGACWLCVSPSSCRCVSVLFFSFLCSDPPLTISESHSLSVVFFYLIAAYILAWDQVCMGVWKRKTESEGKKRLLSGKQGRTAPRGLHVTNNQLCVRLVPLSPCFWQAKETFRLLSSSFLCVFTFFLQPSEGVNAGATKATASSVASHQGVQELLERVPAAAGAAAAAEEQRLWALQRPLHPDQHLVSLKGQ